MIWLRYALLLLIVPAYLIALRRGRWATMPLWLVSASVMLVQLAQSAQPSPALADGTVPTAFFWIAETAKIMLIPIGVQLAAMLKAWEGRAENRAQNSPRRLVASLNTSQL
jgi:hypothetical protein